MTASQPRVLVVEDEPLIRMLAADMLDMLGYAVAEAGAGAEALAISDEDLQGLAALIIDLGLPDRPGEEVARLLRQRRPDLPVIITTGADATVARARMGSDQSVGILEKPYQLNDLQAVLEPLAPVG